MILIFLIAEIIIKTDDLNEILSISYHNLETRCELRSDSNNTQRFFEKIGEDLSFYFVTER